MARRWLVAGAAVVVVVVGGGVAAALTFDPASQKDRIEQAVQRATGRALTIAGPMRMQWGWSPVLEAEDVSLTNMPGGTRPQMASVGQVEAQVELLPLLSGRVEIASVTLLRPDILLETDANGRGNWQFTHPASPTATASPSSGPRMVTQLDRLHVESGRVTWRDGETGRTVVAEVPDATLDLGAGGSTLAAQAVVAGTNVTLQARGGTWAQMTAPGGGPWPAKLDAKAGPASLVLDGAVDPAKRSYAGRVELTAPDLARAGDLLGRPGLPPLRDVHLAMTLPEGGLPTDISLQAGPSDLGAYFKDLMLTRLNLTAASEQAGRVEADGAVAGGPWHLASGWNRAGQRISLRGLTLTSPFGDAQGDVAVTPGAVPSISDTLVSNRVDADAIRAALRSQSPPPPPPSPGAAAAPAPPAEEGFVIPARPLPWAALRRVNADLHLTIGDLHWRGADYRNAVAHVSLQDGLLQVGPAAVSTPAGAVQFSASADARQAAPAFILNLRAGALALDPLLQAAGLPGGSDASLGVDVALQGQGVSPHDLAATLSGHAGVSMVDGEISNAVLAAVLGDVLKRSGVALDPAGRSHVRCLAVRADAEAGVVTLSTFKLDSTRLALDGSGTVNLADETLDLSLKPLIRIGAAGVAAPLQVTGPFRHPAVALEPQRGSGRVGVMLGGLAGPPEDCAAELRAARDGRPGPLPAATAIAQDKLPKPADLLRSLLR